MLLGVTNCHLQWWIIVYVTTFQVWMKFGLPHNNILLWPISSFQQVDFSCLVCIYYNIAYTFSHMHNQDNNITIALNT
jgi:hypothetical protein